MSSNDKKSKKKRPFLVSVLLEIIGLALVAVIAFFAVLTFTEYKPADTEDLEVDGTATDSLSLGDTFTVLTWNTGYAGLGEDADFFMDGGTSVRSTEEDQVLENMSAIMNYIYNLNPEVVFLQEVDEASKRSYYLDQVYYYTHALEDHYQSSFAYNYKTVYVPYPWPTIGQVSAGILTLTNYEVSSAQRISLPYPFSYPVRLCNLKRCLMVSYVDIEGTDAQLVLVNLHLEAYDDGEGKIAQTAQLAELIAAETAKGNYVIAGGDFNQTFSSCDTSSYPQLDEDLWSPGYIDVSDFDSSLQFVMDSSTPTCRSLDQALSGADADSFQYYMIDGFIVSSNITVVSAETIDLGFENSDHNPVVMTVTLK